MRAILFTAACCVLLCGNLSSQSRILGFRNLRFGSVSSTTHNHPASALVFETFDSTGYDLVGWTEVLTGAGGVVNEDYTTNVLSGTQSLYIKIPDDENGYVTNSFTATGTAYGYFQFRPISFATGEDQWKSVFRFEDSSGNSLCKVQIQESGFLRITTGSTSSSLTSVVSVNTTYHVWVYWKNSNGTDSECSLAVSSTQVKPTSGDYFTSATGTATGTQTSRVRLGGGSDSEDAAAGGCSFVPDYVLVDDDEIQSYP